MAWTPTADGFAKARLKKIQQMVGAAIPDLHTALKADPGFSPIASSYKPLDASNVLRGDCEALWDINTGGYFRCYISAGGHREGVDVTQTRLYVGSGPGVGNKRRQYSTIIACLFHEKAFPIGNGDKQSQIREDAYATVSDWMDFDLFGTNATRKFAVDSNCFDNQAGKDFLYDVCITSISKVWTPAGPGSTGSAVLTGASVVLTGFA